MSMLSPLNNEDVRRSMRDTPLDVVDPGQALFAPNPEPSSLRAQAQQQAHQTTVQEGAYTGKGSIINELA